MTTDLTLAVIDGEPRIDSRLVAAGLGVEHKATMQLVDKYSSQFQEFGQLPFEMGVVNGHQGGGNPSKFAVLNENQTYFLMTLVRNTAQAVELKKRLVLAFADCRKRLEQPSAPTFDLATMTGQALRELACKIEECALLQSRIITMQPKADFYDHVAGSEALFDRADAAKLLRTGPKRLWNSLREWKIVQASGTPYQQYFDSGYFRLVPVLVHKGEYSIPYQQTMVTGKGLTWIKGLMDSKVMQSKALVKGDAA